MTALRKSGVPSGMPHAAVRYNGDIPVTCVPSRPSISAIADRIDAATSPLLPPSAITAWCMGVTRPSSARPVLPSVFRPLRHRSMVTLTSANGTVIGALGLCTVTVTPWTAGWSAITGVSDESRQPLNQVDMLAFDDGYDPFGDAPGNQPCHAGHRWNRHVTGRDAARHRR